jgi:hypothetical protein
VAPGEEGTGMGAVRGIVLASIRAPSDRSRPDVCKQVRIVIPIGKSRLLPVEYLGESVGEWKLAQITTQRFTF